MIQLQAGDYPPYFEKYVQLIPEKDPLKVMEKNIFLMEEFVKKIPVEKEDFRYAPDKWTVKEVIGHITDTERIMAYRALRIARNDKKNMEGFDDNAFVANANFSSQNIKNLLSEFILVRKSNIALFSSFTDEMLQRKGLASGNEVTTLAMMYFIPAHEIHHLNFLKEMYL
ncbi:MAG: DinB family protein [Bacteroidia bacterium]